MVDDWESVNELSKGFNNSGFGMFHRTFQVWLLIQMDALKEFQIVQHIYSPNVLASMEVSNMEIMDAFRN
jgi:hypothetical protein